MLQKINDRTKQFYNSIANQEIRLKGNWGILLSVAVVVLLALISWSAYLRWGQGWTWADGTGLGSKTLWDWLELLVIPLVIALGALLLNRAERKNELKIAEDQQREAALHTYVAKMTELLMDKDHPLGESRSGDEGRIVARTYTLFTLRTLDPVRKGLLLQFLCETELIADHRNIVNIDSADLQKAYLVGANLRKMCLARIDFTEADLSMAFLNGAFMKFDTMVRANLTKANLVGAEIQEAKLTEANLTGANLREANLESSIMTNTLLIGADLSGAILYKANLSGADLTNAVLAGAILAKINLTGAKVTNEQLASARSLAHATLPDGDIFDPAIHTFWKEPLEDISNEEDTSDEDGEDRIPDWLQ